jgi:hypothetical protein
MEVKIHAFLTYAAECLSSSYKVLQTAINLVRGRWQNIKFQDQASRFARQSVFHSPGTSPVAPGQERGLPTARSMIVKRITHVRDARFSRRCLRAASYSVVEIYTRFGDTYCLHREELISEKMQAQR